MSSRYGSDWHKDWIAFGGFCSFVFDRSTVLYLNHGLHIDEPVRESSIHIFW